MPRLAVPTRPVIRESLASAGVPLGHLWLTLVVRRSMARSEFIREQLSITRALVKFIRDHGGTVDADLLACLGALERDDIDSAVRHARGVKPHGMGGVTDWWPTAIHESETPAYNAQVLRALTNEWCRMMSFSFDELDRVRRDLQVGELDARVNSKGYVLCPFCHKTFSSASSTSWDGSRHVTCGVRLRLVSAERVAT